MRLNKYLSSYGVCSRREADRAITKGRVTVNGKEAVIGQRIDPEKDEVCFDGTKVSGKPKRIVLAYNKPAGVVCSTVSQGKETNDIISAIGFEERIFPVGRLDKDSTGLILLTNDGELSEEVLKGRNMHEKEYLVEVSSEFTDKELSWIRQGGIPIEENRRTKPCRVEKRSDRLYDFVLTEGMNRQIRKVCSFFNKEVTALKRIRFMNVLLEDLKEGQYRILTDGETDGLYKAVQ